MKTKFSHVSYYRVTVPGQPLAVTPNRYKAEQGYVVSAIENTENTTAICISKRVTVCCPANILWTMIVCCVYCPFDQEVRISG